MPKFLGQFKDYFTSPLFYWTLWRSSRMRMRGLMTWHINNWLVSDSPCFMAAAASRGSLCRVGLFYDLVEQLCEVDFQRRIYSAQNQRLTIILNYFLSFGRWKRQRRIPVVHPGGRPGGSSWTQNQLERSRLAVGFSAISVFTDEPEETLRRRKWMDGRNFYRSLDFNTMDVSGSVKMAAVKSDYRFQSVLHTQGTKMKLSNMKN